MDEAGAPETAVHQQRAYEPAVNGDGLRSTPDPKNDHEALVRTRSAELTRLAYLVTGDRERAIDVATATLTAMRDEWSEIVERGAPQAEARSALVRRLLAMRVRPSGVAASAPAFAGTDAEGIWPTEGEHAAYGLEVDSDLDPVVLEAYAAEPVATRAALVLHEVDQVDSQTTAAVLGLDARALDRTLDTGLNRIAHARQSAARARDRDRPSEAVSAQLRRVLLAESARAGLPLDLSPEVAARRSRTVRRRRLLTAGAGGLGLAAIGAIAGPAVLSGRDNGRLSSAGDAASSSASALDTTETIPVTLSWNAVWSWPARGSLVNDPQVRALTRVNPQQRVIYAERVSGVTLVVSAQRDENRTDANGLPDPQAAMVSVEVITARRTPDTQKVQFGLTGTDPLAVTTAVYGPGGLVILARPEVTSVDVSSTVRFDPDGTSTRIGWKPLRLEAGLGRVAAPALGSFGMAVQYEGHHYAPYSNDLGLQGLFHPAGVTAKRGAWDPDQVVAALLIRARDIACTLTGLDPSAVSVTPVSQTKVPGKVFDIPIQDGPNGSGQQVYPPPDSDVAVLITALPNGARLRTVAAWHTQVEVSGDLVVSALEESVPYPTARLEQRPIVLQGSSAPDGTSGIGILAPGATSVRLAKVQLGPGEKATLPLTDGIAAFNTSQFDDTATMTTLDAKSRTIGTWPLYWSGGGQAWDLYG
ncbi:MAG: hypothetical protein ABI131_11570 [Nostocoides sp.]